MNARPDLDRRSDDDLALRELEGAYAHSFDKLIGMVSPGWQRRRIESRLRITASYRAVRDMRTRRGKKTGQDDGASGDAHLKRSDLDSLREESREMERGNCIAGGLLGRMVDNVVGAGIRAYAVSKDQAYNNALEAAYDADFEITGRFQRWQCERLIYRAMERDGDCGVVLVDAGPTLGVQLVEGHNLGTPINMIGKDIEVNGRPSAVQNGVEHVFEGPECYKPVAYWVGLPVPGASGCIEAFDAARPERTATRRIPARNFVHLYDPMRMTASRGAPALAPIIPLLDKLDEYLDVETTGAKTAAMLVAFISQRNADILNALRATQETDSDGKPVYYEKLKNGQILYGEPGEGVDIISGNRPNQNFPDFVRSVLAFAGMNLGIPLQILLLDFGDAVFASIKAAFLQAKVPWKCKQQVMTSLERRLWSWKIGARIRRREIASGDDALKARFGPPGWPWFDPEKEINATETKIANGVETLEGSCAEIGEDWRDLIAQRQIEILEAQRLADEANGRNKALSLTWKDFIGGARKALPAPAPEKPADDPKRKA